jgi:tRNA(His) 5'-end guanylyltransferase
MKKQKSNSKFMDIGTRMKENYENRSRHYLTRRTPVIMRLDGRAFHTLTRKCEKPFDDHFSKTMELASILLCQQIQGAKLAYVQSDEISLLLTDFDKLNTEAWFDYNIQKMTSIAASIASLEFTHHFSRTHSLNGVPIGLFDCRVFNVPEEEVVNYFVWRQKDWLRNSIHMLARAHYSHKELHNKNSSDMHEMLHEKEINWTNLEDRWKNGVFIDKYPILNGKWNARKKCPIFTDKGTRLYIENILMTMEE